MIEVQKLNGTVILINPDLIRVIEISGDTVVTFTDGETLIVKTKAGEIIDRIVAFRQRYMTSPDIKRNTEG